MTSSTIDIDSWKETFKPIVNPNCSEEELEGFLFNIRTDIAIIDSYPANQIWTLIDADGLRFIIPGKHYVNREGYCLTNIPHAESTPEVEIWGHDDELDFVLDTVEDTTKFSVSHDNSILFVEQDDEEAEEIQITDRKCIEFKLGNFDIQAELNASGDILSLRGVQKDLSLTGQVKTKVALAS